LWAVPLGWWLINSRLSIVPWLPTAIYPGEIATALVVVIGAVEYTRMLSISYPKNGFWLGPLWISLVLLLNFVNPSRPATYESLPAGLGIYILLIIVAVEAFIWGRQTKRRWSRASLFFSGNVFLYISGVSILHLFQSPFGHYFRAVADWSFVPMDRMGMTLVLGAIFLCDTGAYAIGSLFGKHHFTSISPRKTVEGSIAGLVTAFLITAIGWYFLRQPGMPLVIGPVLGLVIGVFAQAGDLLVSLIKRYFRVKDASDIIPGHGGILDRFDSLFFTAPVLWLFFWTLNRLMPFSG
jgi:phosphatidate cytidylyltransferase